MPTEVAPGVHRCGSELINWYLVEDGGEVTVVDAAVPGYWPQVAEELKAIGRSLSDVTALVLTHAHVDHIGFAERLRTEAGATVRLHDGDAAMATEGEQPQNEGGMSAYLWRAAAIRLIAHLARNGAVRVPRIGEVSTIGDGDRLDIPGNPLVIHTPGHTEGHCVFALEERGALFAGDALCTYNPLTGAKGPQLMPRAFTLSSARALGSLERIEQADPEVILPGHGDPWRDGAAEAVERARARGPT